MQFSPFEIVDVNKAWRDEKSFKNININKSATIHALNSVSNTIALSQQMSKMWT